MIGSKADVGEIKRLSATGMKREDIAAAVGVHLCTVNKYLGTKRNFVDREITQQAKRVFPVKIGDVISAYETEITKTRHNYTVEAIYRHIYTARRVITKRHKGAEPDRFEYLVSFQIKDYGQHSDPARVKLIRTREGKTVGHGDKM